MQKTNVISLLVASVFATASLAHAAEALTKNEQAIETQVTAAPKTTIGRLSQKQLELYELELDAKIADVKTKKSGGDPRGAALPNVPMAPVSISSSRPVDEMTLSAIFGRSSDLQAELIVDGSPFVVKKGSNGIPGWKVVSIQSDRVVLNNGKRTKEVYLTTATESAPATTNAPVPGAPLPMPGLPMMNGVR